MKIRYIGGHDEVEIDETGQVCKRGETVEVDNDLGKRLAEQKSNWEPVKSGAKSKGDE